VAAALVTANVRIDISAISGKTRGYPDVDAIDVSRRRILEELQEGYM
jgi:hypothetical protein